MNAVDREALAAFTLRLIAAESLTNQEAEVARLVEEEMRRLGYDVEVDELGNVLGSLGGGSPCVLVDSHMDTVGVTDPEAWTASPRGERRGERIYGRGAMDMKGPLAASVHGIATLRGRLPRGRVVVCASVAEEEVEGPATQRVAERLHPDFAVICEATSLQLARGQRGRAEVVVEVFGTPTHSSRPELGVNAAEAMIDVLTKVRAYRPSRHEVLGEGILVLTDVVSRPYPGLSVVPDYCRATLDRRTLPGETEDVVLAPVRAALERALGRGPARGATHIQVDEFTTYAGVRMEAPNFAPAWFFAEDEPVVRLAASGLERAGIPPEISHYAFCTNGSATAGKLGIPTVGFGPGDEKLAHRVDESIEVGELERGARGYAAIVEALLATSPG